MQFLYTLAVRLYLLGIRLAAPFNEKAARWLQGRREWAERLERDLARIRPAGAPLIWVHCASLGEFEQGRPVIEALRAELPQAKVLLTFFSPSGYEVRKDYALAHLVTYLPADTPGRARRFVEIADPDLAIFVKYEFWFHHLRALHRRGTPTLLISALFRPGQVFFRWYGGLFRDLLPAFDRIFVQNEGSAELLDQLGLDNYVRSGDTRIDRVLSIAEEKRSFPLVESFSAGTPMLVAGSTWPPDEAILAELAEKELPPAWKIILAPHEIREDHLRDIERAFPLPSLRYSQATTTNVSAARLLIIDNVGMLSALYRYGRIAYIGGAFGSGLHNTLEPVAFGLPVLFGPRYQKFEEARRLVQTGGAVAVEDAAALRAALRQLSDPERWKIASDTARRYVEDNRGGTEQIVAYILQKLKAEKD